LSTKHETSTSIEDQSLKNGHGQHLGADWQNSKRFGIAPSQHLRRHFVALSRRIKHWSSPVQRPVKIGITSIDRGVGKSTIAFNLAAILARIDGVLIAVEADRIDRKQIARSKNRIAQSGADLVGLIINQA